MRLVAIFAATAVVALIGTSAMGQTTTAPATTTTPMTTTKTPSTTAKQKAATPAQSEISKACSAQADAKGLHGKERSKFRSQCKKNGGKG
ncbi:MULTISPECIES: PsiF family protein [Rhizobium]|uniref:Carbohydrate-binding DOMON domain-containing protein n=1 Tax=Rhizobium paranaense TaxID=1650438 RepID=A0A7W8XT47_9HYPH|nr:MULTISPECIES: PsiF family protein [Rhizobium]MBB5575114.1 carbohydrate-binding DOMON domain-containing protein [Rhizobium paranaense]PST64454.1 hypothetical protein C9E91_02930 [Rhizobium sp. SEMIA4064]